MHEFNLVVVYKTAKHVRRTFERRNALKEQATLMKRIQPEMKWHLDLADEFWMQNDVYLDQKWTRPLSLVHVNETTANERQMKDNFSKLFEQFAMLVFASVAKERAQIVCKDVNIAMNLACTRLLSNGSTPAHSEYVGSLDLGPGLCWLIVDHLSRQSMLHDFTKRKEQQRPDR